MDLSFLHIADYANITQDQKLNVMGIFSNIAAFTFPATHPEMCVVVQFVAESPEYRRKFKLEVKLVSEDGDDLVSLAGESQMPEGQNGMPVSMNLIFRLVNTTFPKAGSYGLYVLVDNDIKGSVPVELIQVQPPQPPSGIS